MTLSYITAQDQQIVGENQGISDEVEDQDDPNQTQDWVEFTEMEEFEDTIHEMFGGGQIPRDDRISNTNDDQVYTVQDGDDWIGNQEDQNVFATNTQEYLDRTTAADEDQQDEDIPDDQVDPSITFIEELWLDSKEDQESFLEITQEYLDRTLATQDQHHDDQVGKPNNEGGART